MANRGMDAATLAEFDKDQVHLVQMLEMNFSTVLRITDHTSDLSYGGNTYNSVGSILDIGQVQESLAMEKNTLQITMSGCDPANIAIALTESYTNKEVAYYVGVLNTALTLVGAFTLFKGRIANYSFQESLDEDGLDSTIIWTVTNHWVDFERVAGRRTNDTDQQLYYPGDKFFEFTGQPQQEHTWGSR